MLEHNDKTGKWDEHFPVDTTCMSSPEGCPAMYLRASLSPLEDLQLLAYPGQDVEKRLYKAGYESFFNTLPVLNPGEPNNIADFKMKQTFEVILSLAKELEQASWVVKEPVGPGEFHRHIIGMEKPITGSMFGDEGVYVKQGGEGKELLVAHWGDGFVSPVHGHKPGLEVEILLGGSVAVNRYRLVNPQDADSKAVRITSTTSYTGSEVIELQYKEAGKNDIFPYQQLIHNFVSYGRSNSLHYVPGHSRDGRDNSFNVQYFEDFFDVDGSNTQRIMIAEALSLKPGAVVLVRSASVPALRDHFCVITGGLVVKSVGMRQKDTAIMVKGGHSDLLDGHLNFDSSHEADTVLLQLSDELALEFIKFHDIKIEDSCNDFDDVYDLHYDEVSPITTEQGMYSRIGDVILVRSRSLNDIGDHYILVTGHPVVKDHGVRPQTAVFNAMQNSPLLDMFDTPALNTVLLKLNDNARKAFLNHYNIHLENGLITSDTRKLEML